MNFLNIKYLTFLGLMMISAFSHANGAKPIDWNDEQLVWFDYAQGMNEMAENGSNGLLIFYADWCPVCQHYSTLFQNPSVVDSLQGLTLMRVNVEIDKNTSKLFDLDGQYVPRTFALNSEGHVVKSLYPNKSRYWYFIPADDPNFLIDFSEKLMSVN